MKVILLKHVPELGEENDLVSVSEGYARNFLLPRKLAMVAGPGQMANLEKRRAEQEKKLAGKRDEFEKIAKKLSALEISVPVDAGEAGKLFGSVTAQDISLAIKQATQIDLDKKKVELPEPIKLLGDYKIAVKLFQDITANIKVKVIANK